MRDELPIKPVTNSNPPEKGMRVVVWVSADELPKKAAMYAGQEGNIVDDHWCGSGHYFEVQFDNGDIAAYLGYELGLVPNTKEG